MSKKRNSVFSGVVPVLGTAQTTAPISLGAMAVRHYHSNTPTADPTVRYSTGSTLLDSFVQDAEYSAFSLQTELTTLSLELKRVANPRIELKSTQNFATDLPNSAVQAKRKAIAQARRQAQQQALKTLQQAKQLTQRQAQSKVEIVLPETRPGGINPRQMRPSEMRPEMRPEIRYSETQPSKRQAGGAKLGAQKSSAVKVYGGADYKAMQARAQAGGLVNLEDDLLFGGAEKSATKKGQKAVSGRFELELLFQLSQPLEDFTASSIPGGWHPTAYLGESEQRTDEPYQTVVGIDDFKLSDLDISSLEPTSEDNVLEEMLGEKTLGEKTLENDLKSAERGDDLLALKQLGNAGQAELADLDALGRQVSYLNQRIEFLSRQLAAMAGVEASRSASRDLAHPASSGGQETAAHPFRSSVVLRLSDFETAEEGGSERRVATLEPLVGLR